MTAMDLFPSNQSDNDVELGNHYNYNDSNNRTEEINYAALLNSNDDEQPTCVSKIKEEVNPHRQRGPFTNAYTCAGWFLGAGTTAMPIWYLSSADGDRAPHTLVAWIASIALTLTGLTCYCATNCANIFYTKCNKKQLKKKAKKAFEKEF